MDHQEREDIKGTLFDFILGVFFGIGLAIAFEQAKSNYHTVNGFVEAQAVNFEGLMQLDDETKIIALSVVVATLMLYSIIDMLVQKRLMRKQQIYMGVEEYDFPTVNHKPIAQRT